MNFLGIIPARYASSRFPGKPLVNINGKSMIQRVYEQACKSTILKKVVVATDDERIQKHVEEFGGNVVMTSSTHPTGTDRCCEVLLKEKETWDAVINIQGDEPFIDPKEIDLLCSCFTTKRQTQIATLIKKIKSIDALTNESTVKVIVKQNGEAIYFSRSPLPHIRGLAVNDWLSKHTYFKHIGIYGYTTSTLKIITQLPQSSLELAESLEQLRWIENGVVIQTAVTEGESQSVDTPEDLEKILKSLVK
jgi:3-deoxy-manno-octulosonate cytidylyltransferase (CMP-KDO synthetase)